MSEPAQETPTLPKDSNLRKVTDLVLKNVGSYEELNLPPEQRGKKFLEVLSESLTKSPARPTGLKGEYLYVYKPEVQGQELPVAVKVFRVHEGGFGHRKNSTFLAEFSHTELQETMDDPNYILLSDREPGTSFESLTDEEQSLVLLAHEHRLCQKFYSPYVLPALFVSFESQVDIPAPENDLAKDPLWQKHWERELQQLKEEGRLTADGKPIYIKKGEKVFAMVQNFENLSPPIFSLSPEELNPTQIRELADLAHKIKQTYERYGYFPDLSFTDRRSGNLKLKDGHVVLIDTNGIWQNKSKINPINETLQKINNFIAQAQRNSVQAKEKSKMSGKWSETNLLGTSNI